MNHTRGVDESFVRPEIKPSWDRGIVYSQVFDRRVNEIMSRLTHNLSSRLTKSVTNLVTINKDAGQVEKPI